MLIYRQLQAEDSMRRDELRMEYHATLAPGAKNFTKLADAAREALSSWGNTLIGRTVSVKEEDYRRMYEELTGLKWGSDEFNQYEHAVVMQYSLKYGKTPDV